MLEKTPLTANEAQGPVSLAEGVRLFDWQQEAVESWWKGGEKGPGTGTLEIFTGGGKTLIALAAFVRACARSPGLRLAVVVPTEALARQWVMSITTITTVPKAEIGLLGAGRRDALENKRVLVAVLNSAARRLPDMARATGSLMLVVDECHRAGATTFSKVLSAPSVYRLGLSATPARDEVDDAGLPLSYDRQVVGRQLGEVVFRFGLREAREIGWLPEYVVHHHGVRLTVEERAEYERISRKVSDAADAITASGFQTSQAWHLAASAGEIASLAQGYVAAVAARKDFLYRVEERTRVATRIVRQCLTRESPRIILFHERVTEAEGLYAGISKQLPDPQIVLEHSALPSKVRREALDSFRKGTANVLVSVKALVEGIDVPDADVGVSVASSSSVRQRIQTLGRVLRRRFDGGIKRAEMHVIYAHDTVDELIYSKEDWSDLTGDQANCYWLWPTEPEGAPEPQPGPPMQPRPSEEAEWKRLGEAVPPEPVQWMGQLPDHEFSVDTRGNVKTAEGGWIDNAQNVAELVAKVRGRPGGKFRVTPQFNLVIVYGESESGMVPLLAGQLTESLRLREAADVERMDVDVQALQPGAPYYGPTDRVHGVYKIRQKRGGVIERKRGHDTEFASTDNNAATLAQNGAKLLQAWRSLSTSGMTFYVNSLWHAWYQDAGQPRFLAAAPNGFLWPTISDGDVSSEKNNGLQGSDGR